MACLVVSIKASRGALHLVKVKLGIIEFVFCEHGEVTVEEILGASQRIESDASIVRAPSELVGGLREKKSRGRPWRRVGGGTGDFHLTVTMTTDRHLHHGPSYRHAAARRRDDGSPLSCVRSG